MVNELYFEVHCGKYICHEHFLNKDFSQSQFEMICGNIEETELVKEFAKNYCRVCGRKMF